MQIPVVSCQASSALPSWRGQAKGKASAWQGVWNRIQPSLQEEGVGGKEANSCMLRGGNPQIERCTHTLQAVTQNAQSGTTLSSKDTRLPSPF